MLHANNTFMKKVLILGNIPTRNPKSIGGATVYTESILEELHKANGLEVTHVQTRKNWNKYGQILDFVLLFIKLPFLLHKKEIVSIHASWDFHVSIGPFIYLISSLFNKKIIYHFFGGNFHNQYHNFPLFYKKWLDITIFKSDFVLMETKQMIEYFKSKIDTNNFIWFPNSRRIPSSINVSGAYSKRFVFVSRVTKTKGIDLLLEVSKELPLEYSIDVYGPLDENFYTNQTFENSNLNYKGVISSNEVIKTLSNYDIVVLPSYYKGEGYPGILIEAMSMGKPIITTHLNALNEIVTDRYNGLLIEQQSVTELKQAILFFNNNNYKEFVDNSLKKFTDFNIENVTQKLVNAYITS